jgi:hypothetical protein
VILRNADHSVELGMRSTFQIALSQTGGPSRVVAGDLDGFFIESEQGFHFIPSVVFMTAIQEGAKSNYEVLDIDRRGRPELIRMRGIALAGMITDRVFPAYPDSARKKRITGTVVLSVRIGKNGRVREVRVNRDLQNSTRRQWTR